MRKRRVVSKKNNKKKMFILLSLFLFSGVGYAFISTNLGITGLGNFRANSWDISFTSVTEKSSNITVLSPEDISEDGKSINFSVNFKQPGEEYVFYADIENNGTIPAMLNSMEVEGLTDDAKKYLDTSVTYADGIAINQYDLLDVNKKETIKVRVNFKTNIEIEDLPKNGDNLRFKLTANYLLKDENAKERVHGTENSPNVSYNDETTSNEGDEQVWVKSATVTFDVSDEEYLKSVKYCISETDCVPDLDATIENNQFSYTFPDSSTAQKVCMTATNVFGKTTTTCSNSYFVDGEKPIITNLNVVGDSDNESINILVEGRDNISGISKYYYSKDGGENFVSSNNANYSFTSLNMGEYEIVTYVEDAAGNISETSASTVTLINNDIYAILYDDGTLGLNSNGVANPLKTVVKSYGKLTNNYTYFTHAPWYNDYPSITTVDIENKIYPTKTSYWFQFANNITEFLHPENLDTSYATDLSYMFQGTTSLTSLDVSTWDTSHVTSLYNTFTSIGVETLDLSSWDVSNVTNMYGTFNYAQNLTSLNISTWDTSKVTTMDGMFGYTKKLTSLDIGNWNVSNVTSMRALFERSDLKELDLHKWNTSSVTDISWMFSHLENLESLNISGWDTSKLTNISYAFYNTKKIEVLDQIGTWNTSNVTNMENVFCGCSNLKIVNLSNWNTSKVEIMATMFGWCSNLETIVFGNGFTTNNVTRMESMFNNCPKLTGLDVSNWNTAKVTNMNSLFSNCGSLTSLNVGNWNTSNVTDMGRLFYGCSKVEELDVSTWDTRKVTNMLYMFGNCSSIDTLDVSKFITSNVTQMSYMFYGCSKIEQINVSKFDTSKITSMEGMFSGCSSLTSLDVSKFNTASVTTMSSMFSGCSSLTTLDLSKFDISSLTNISSMFYLCKNIETIILTGWDVSNIEEVQSLFAYCNKLKTITEINSWKLKKATNLSYMFMNCEEITSLDLSGFDVSNVTQMYATFEDMKKVTSLGLENWTTSSVTRIDRLFNGCSSIQSLNLTKWDVSNVTNLESVFANMSSLTSLNISNWTTSNVTSTYSMFEYTNNLENVDITNFDMSNVTYMSRMFLGCVKLNGLDVSKWDTRKVTNYQYTFSDTSKDANSTTWYYGDNSSNLVDYKNEYMTFEYKRN